MSLQLEIQIFVHSLTEMPLFYLFLFSFVLSHLQSDLQTKAGNAAVKAKSKRTHWKKTKEVTETVT